MLACAVLLCRVCCLVSKRHVDCHLVSGAYDFVTETQTQYGEQFGWWSTSNTDTSSSKYRIVSQLYLLEWTTGTAGQTNQEPDSKVMVSHRSV